MFFKHTKKQRGQAIVEYALLLLIVVLSATAYLQMNDSLSFKLQLFTQELLNQPTGYVPETEIKDKRPEQLSPPVADFDPVTPIYKGRETKFINRSFDIDGYIEHYIWTVNGTKIQKHIKDYNSETYEGLTYTFRNKGTYTVSLTVVDNDGLISNTITKTVVVDNRNPTLTLTVKDIRTGTVSSSSVNVEQGCSAEFRTDYDDPDLPYEILTLYSKFTDHSGVISEYDTAPNLFTREFKNMGTSTYFVSITDEDGSSVSRQVTVNVVPNISGSCAATVTTSKPTFKINVTGHYEIRPNGVYCFKTDGSAIATLTPVITQDKAPLHATPYWWQTEKFENGAWVYEFQNATNQWNASSWNPIYRPYPKRPWLPTDAKVKVTGMGRDTQSTTNSPDPTENGKTNKDTVYLAVEGSPDCPVAAPPSLPVAVISVNNDATTKNPLLLTDAPTNIDYTKDVSQSATSSFTATINSKFSASPQGIAIKGVQFVMYDKAHPTGITYPADNSTANNAFAFKDISGNTDWWLPINSDSPDTLGGRIFKYGEGLEGNSNVFKYELKVIDMNGRISKVVTKKIILTKNTGPIVNCPSPTPQIEVNTQFGTKVQVQARDPEGQALRIQFSPDGTSFTPLANMTTTVPSTNPVFYQAGPPTTWVRATTGTFNMTVKVLDATNTATTKVCPVNIVEATSSPLNPEFYTLYERVRYDYNDIEVINASVPKSEITNTMWKYSTPIGPSNKRDVNGDSVNETIKWSTDTFSYSPKIVQGNTNNSTYDDSVTLNTMDFQATFQVNIFITNAQGDATCVEGRGVRVLDGGKYWCKKGTTYWRVKRTELLAIPNIYTGLRQVCTVNTTHYTLPDIDTLIAEFPYIPKEYNTYTDPATGKTVTNSVEKQFEPHLILRNCKNYP